MEDGHTGITQAGELRSARLESVRAVAALGVLVSHVYGVAHGFGPAVYVGYWHRVLFGGGFGVYLFFALTGYLIYLPFARRDFGSGRQINLRTYARNRAVRILPLYYVVLIVLFVVQEHGGTFGQWWRFAFFGETFFRRTVGTVDGPLWSLVVELHFYLLVPVIAWLLARAARRSAARAATILGLSGVVFLIIRIALVEGNAHPDRRWSYSLPATFLFFLPGMLLALARTASDSRRPVWLSGPLARSDVWIMASLALWAVVFWRYNLGPLAAAASFFVVGACTLPLEPGRLVSLLEWRPLAALGVASYSLYIWHLPIVEHLAGTHSALSRFSALFVVAVPLCCLVAVLSYRIIEAPFLRLRRPWAATAAQTTTARR